MTDILIEISNEILSIQNLTKTFIEEAIKDKAKEFIDRMIRKQILDAAAATSGGISNALVAAANNFEVDWKEETVSVEVPSVTFDVKLEEIGRVRIPEVTMTLKTVAVLDIPEIVMVRRRVGDHHHVKVLHKWVKVGPLKTKVPNGLKRWTTPAYAHVPETRTRREEIKTYIPVVSWREEILKTDLPSVVVEMKKEEFSVPVPKGISVDIEGFVLDAIPASNVIKEIIIQLREAEEFVEEYTEKAEHLLDDIVGKVTKKVLNQIEIFENQIEDINGEYEKIKKRLIDIGATAHEIENQVSKRNEEIERILESLKPYHEALKKIENARKKALQLIENIKVPLP